MREKLSQKLLQNECSNIISQKDECYLNNLWDNYDLQKKNGYLHENQRNREIK